MAMATAVPVLLGISEQYTRDSIRRALEASGRYEVVDFHGAESKVASFDRGVLWLEYEDLPFDQLIMKSDRLLANSYCIRKGLIRKSQMAYTIAKYLSKHVDSILKTAVPETYQFELDDPYYFEEAMSEVFEVAAELRENELLDGSTQSKKWILKPSITNKGAEIFIFDREDQLREMFEERYERLCAEEDSEGNGDTDDGHTEEDDSTQYRDQGGNLAHIREWVMQRYVSNPLLLYGGRKFHIRTYVVASGNIKVFVYREMLALFSAMPYDISDLSSKCHITNTCVQADEPSFDESASVRRFWSLDDAIPQQRLESIHASIVAIVGEVFRSVAHEVTVFQALPNLFELYGLDFLVDADDSVHFLEANAFPDFRQTGSDLQPLIDGLFAQTLVVALDPFFGLPAAATAPDMTLALELKLRSS